MLNCTFKLISVSLISFAIIIYGMWIFLNMVYAFFKASGYPTSDQFKYGFYDYIFTDLSNYFSYGIIFFIVLFCIGMYLSYILLHPFRLLSKFSDKMMNGEDIEWELSWFDRRKYLLEFSQHFFSNLGKCKNSGSVVKGIMPDHLKKIDGVVFDKFYYTMYICFLCIIILMTSTAIFIVSQHMFESIISIAMKNLQMKDSLITFFAQQGEVLNSMILISITIMMILYYVVGNQIFNKINGVSYAYFRSLRHIYKGDWTVRIQLRFGDPGMKDSIKMNSLLDYINQEMIGAIIDAEYSNEMIDVVKEESPPALPSMK